jgi:hypothetical protein
MALGIKPRALLMLNQTFLLLYFEISSHEISQAGLKLALLLPQHPE